MAEINAKQARAATKRAIKKKQAAANTESAARKRAGARVAPALLARFEAEIRKDIKSSIKHGETEASAYFGSFDWEGAESVGAPIAAAKLTAKLRAEGFDVTMTENNAFRYTNSDGCPTNYNQGSTSIRIVVRWGEGETS